MKTDWGRKRTVCEVIEDCFLGRTYRGDTWNKNYARFSVGCIAGFIILALAISVIGQCYAA